MEKVKISARGQVTIPYAIRAKMNLKSGDTVAFVEEKGKIYVFNPSKKVTFNSITLDTRNYKFNREEANAR